MRIINTTIYELNIPFVDSFSHSTKSRGSSDSIVVRVATKHGVIGYGEGVARPYVTGETVESCVDYIKDHLWPVIREVSFGNLDTGQRPLPILKALASHLPEERSDNVIAWHAARTAVELAIIDAWLKQQNLDLSSILPPKRKEVVYSGVITASSPDKATKHAKQFKLFGIRQLKVKVGDMEDINRVASIREKIGPDISIRLDANGAYTPDEAIKAINKFVPYQIDCIEQPIPRGDPSDMARVRKNTAIPIMVDESLVTLEDAKKLIDADACDYFNLRISKCGGLARTLEIAELAREAGIKIQLGCQVGETAILSAAGRHLAAFLDEVEFVEGSYGKLLLTEDISRDSIQFGHGGRAPVLKRPGLGIQILDDRLDRYAERITRC